MDLEMPFKTTCYIKPGSFGITPKQRLFLSLNFVEDILYGGAAGGGKSWVLLAAALQYVDIPAYAALILRKTYQDLSKPGGLLDEAKNLLIPQGVRYDSQEHRFRFPSGASLVFGHLETSEAHLQYQGQEYQFCGIDESTQIPQRQLEYLHSRLRKTVALVTPIRYRLTSNPGGVSHSYHRAQYIDNPIPQQRVYLPARLEDNPYLQRDDYLRQLAYLDPVTRSQLVRGDWTARVAGGLFRRETFGMIDAVSPINFATVRAWDLAASKDGKRTCGVKMSRSVDGYFDVESVALCQKTPHERDAFIRAVAETDGTGVRILFEREGGSGGIAQVETLAAMLEGYYVIADADGKLGIRPTGEKVVRAGALASQAAACRVRLVRGAWNGPYVDEMEAAAPDAEFMDQVDASSLAFNWIATQSLRAPPTPSPERERVDPATDDFNQILDRRPETREDIFEGFR